MTETKQESGTVVRALWTTVGLLLLTALLLWLSSLLPWSSPRSSAPGLAYGNKSSADPALIPLAIVALAAIAGAVALSGLLRRILGVLVLCVPVLIWWRAADGITTGPLAGRILAAIAGILAAGAALILVWSGHRMPRLGSRYQAKSAARTTAQREQDLWRALDAGADPTTQDRPGASAN